MQERRRSATTTLVSSRDRSIVPAEAGTAVSLAGLGLVGAVWARREAERALSRERITGTTDMRPPGAPVRSAGSARCLAEVIRSRTLAASGGRTYAETDEFLAADGGTMSDAALALVAADTGQPVHNPEYELWVTSTTLQTALAQAYLAFRLADLTAAIGAALAVAGVGIAASARALR